MAKLGLAALVVFTVCSFACADNVPVLVWGSNAPYTTASTLKTTTTEEFYSTLAKTIKDKFVIVFTENKLSIEDLSQCKTAGQSCFANIKKVDNKLYLSNVVNPVEAIYELAANKQTELTVTSDGVLSAPLKVEAGKFAIVSLQDSVLSEKRSTQLSNHDSIIASVLKELDSKKIVVVYTGRQNNVHSRHIRQAPQNNVNASTPVADNTVGKKPENKQQDVVANATFFSTDRVLLYYNQLEHVAEDKSSRIVNFTAASVTELSTSALTVTLTGDGTNTLKFNITRETGYWSIKSLLWNDNDLIVRKGIGANDRFSFTCNPAIVFRTSKSPVLYWSGLQLQPRFGDLSNETFIFGDANDCVGFTSPGIWGGLFVTFLMIIILSLGISWMMDIRTMDRFDDPKGKTITVNINE